LAAVPTDFRLQTSPVSDAITEGVRVEVMSRHVPDHSPAREGQWVFEYTVRITNGSSEPVQLVSRHWLITDALEQLREVKGMGVVGKQPILQPGEQFQYSSWCPLPTPTGVMHGTYQMARPGGGVFDVEIAPFSLRAGYTVH
jgi:ApaG protein